MITTMAMIQEKTEKAAMAIAVLRELYEEVRHSKDPDHSELRYSIQHVAGEPHRRAGLRTIDRPKLSALEILKVAVGRTPRVRPSEQNWRGKPISRGQRYKINRLCNGRVNPDAECQRVLNCEVDELSMQAASAYIDFLEASAVEGAEETERRDP